MRRPLAAAVLFLVAFFMPAAALAQRAPSEIEVRVADQAGAPLADARIFITGPLITSALTPHDGVVRFSDVDAGIYQLRIVLAGYEAVAVDDVEALPGRRRVVSVTLLRTHAPTPAPSASPAAGNLTVIGRVQARSSATVTSVDVDEGDPLRRVSENLSDALAKIAGVSVAQPSGSGTLTISLRNADPSRTIASVGGVPLLGGAAPQLQQVAADLAVGASVDAGGPGPGGVNFRTIEPTRTWQTQLSAQYGSYEHALASFAVSGAIKKLSLAVQHDERSEDSILTGLTFADTSGEEYRHDGADRRTANYAKLRYAVSPKLTFVGSFLTGGSWASSVCDSDVTNVPCGYGPGNATYGLSRNGSLGVQGQLGNVTVSGTVFANSYDATVDDRRLVVAGVAEPFFSETRGSGRGWYGYASLGVKRHTFYLAGSGFGGGSTAAAQGAFQATTTTAFRHGYLALDDAVKMSDRWSVDTSVGTSSSTAGSGASGGVSLTLRPSRAETFGARFGFSANTAAYYQLGSFGDPAQGTYDCKSDAVRVTGPGEQPGTGSTSNVELTWDRRGRRGTLRVDAFDRVERGAFLQAQFPLVALGSAAPNGYLGAVETIWNQPLICGGTPFDPSRVYVAETVSGPTVRYRGVDTSGQLVIGRQTIAVASYGIDGAVLASPDARLVRSGSPYAVGAQLPFRPLHAANVLVDLRQPKAQLEYMVDARWSSANNPYALTSYTIVAAGVTWQAQRGRLTLLANNVFGEHTGLFATTQFAQPLALVGGGTYLPVPTLLAPRSYTLLYTVRTGRTR